MVIEKDNYYDICNLFKKWLSTNGHRFNKRYKVRHYKKRGCLKIYFQDVTPEIDCFVCENGNIGVGVIFKRRFWDIINELDCYIHRSRNRKYYCSLCTEPLFYETPWELLIDHSFEPLLEWVNSHFTSAHALMIRNTISCGGADALLIDKNQLDSLHSLDREDYVY